MGACDMFEIMLLLLELVRNEYDSTTNTKPGPQIRMA